MKFGNRKILLCLIGLSLSACGSGIPEPPEVWQCQVNGTPRAFYCVNTKTHERNKLAIDDSEMKGAQCLSADDYLKSEAYVKTLIELAKSKLK